MNRKLRVLWCGETSFLNTGYAIYAREVLKRLYSTDKYEIAELGCYGRHDDGRRFDVPWHLYSNLPTNTDEANLYNQNLQEYQFGSWRFEDVCLHHKPDVVIDVRDWWMAIANGLDVIQTQQGYKCVKDIVLGDLLLTHSGNYKKVLHVFNKKYSGIIYKIKASHFPLTLDLTPLHPVLAIKRTTDNLPNFQTEKPEWINSDKLKTKDLVCYPRRQFVKSDMQPSLCRLLGYYTAEGCILYNGKKIQNKLKGVQFTLNVNELDFINDIRNLVVEHYGVEPTIKFKDDNSCVIRAYSKQIAIDMNKFCCGTARTKILSNEIYHTSKENILEFLCGYFRGDGCTNNKTNRSSCNTSSKELALQLFQLCVDIGVLPSCGYNKNKLKNKTFWRYIFGFSNASHISFYNIYNRQWNIIPNKRITKDYAFLTIKSIITEEIENIDVYNFEVEDDNTYVSSFCLHNCEHEERSPYRPYYHWAIMPTVDSHPQQDQYLATYMNADTVFTYSEYGKRVLESESNGYIKVRDIASPGADLNVMKPVLNKSEHRRQNGFMDDITIVGTIMRNQRRKLYPNLIRSFKRMLVKNPELQSNTFLYLHTSYPDNGWDIPDLIKENDMGRHTLLTYMCTSPTCNTFFPSFFQDARTVCPKCHKLSAIMPNAQKGTTPEQLTSIINWFDLYVQYSICEGFGMPQVEAGACGVPLLTVDFSAMESVGRNLKAGMISLSDTFRDCPTGSWRAIPDDSDLEKQMLDFVRLPKTIQMKKGMDTYVLTKKRYNWDNTTKIWENFLDSLVLPDLSKTWESQPRFHQPSIHPNMDSLTNEQFVRWGVSNIWGHREKMNSYMALRMLRDLNYGQSIGHTGDSFHNEASYLATIPQYQPFGRNEAVQMLKNMCDKQNFWERKRCGPNQQTPYFIQASKPDDKNI